MSSDQIRENRVRRAAHRQGMHLMKSRRRDTRAVDYGNFWLALDDSNGIVCGGQWGTDLDTIEQFLDGYGRDS